MAGETVTPVGILSLVRRPAFNLRALDKNRLLIHESGHRRHEITDGSQFVEGPAVTTRPAKSETTGCLDFGNHGADV